MVLSHLAAVEIDGTVMTGPFEGEQDPLALPFGRNMQMASVAADHLVERFVKIVKRGLLTGMRDSDGLQGLFRVFCCSHPLLKVLVKKPVFA